MSQLIKLMQDKPIIGVASGFGSGAILSVQDFLTNDQVLKIVAALAAWAGFFVAMLTLFVWSVKAYRTFKALKNPKTPTNEEVI